MLVVNQLNGFNAFTGGAEQNVYWNSADKSANIVLSNGDLDANANTAAWGTVRTTVGKATGKWYWEEVVTAYSAGTGTFYGLCLSSHALGTYLGSGGTSGGMRDSVNGVATWTKNQAGTTTLALNDVWGFALDMGSGRCWVSKNGTYVHGDPAADTNPWITGITGTVYPAVSCHTSNANIARLRTKTADFLTAPPTGFSSYATI